MRHLRLAVAAALLAAASAASATTFVAVADRDLAAQAPVIARVTVTHVAAGPANRPPATDYLVDVDELVQGSLGGGTIVVRVPGGNRADGLTQLVAGAPELVAGEQALLFLAPGEDGTYGILHLMLGAFHGRRVGGRELAEQDLSGAQRLGPAVAGEEKVRDLGRFTDWLADRAAGVERPADYWMERPAGDVASTPAKAYSALSTADQIPVRWFGLDAGGSVSWRLQSSGQPGVDFGQTVAAVQAALDVWTADPTSAIRHTYSGTTTATTGIASTDGVNAVLFDDPHGQLPGTFDCRTGGVLAFGGPMYYTSTTTYRGKAYHEIVEADIVTNDGSTCFMKDNPLGVAEVFTHELGHTLGFGHASDAHAAMYAFTHNDGRGARLGEDDKVGASVVYGDGSYQPAAPEPPGGDALVLAAVAGRTAVDLSWSNPFSAIDTFVVESKTKKGFRALETVGGDALAATVAGLKPNQVVTLRITATRDGAVVGSSNVVKLRTRR